jgi:hypothetical protein
MLHVVAFFPPSFLSVCSLNMLCVAFWLYLDRTLIKIIITKALLTICVNDTTLSGVRHLVKWGKRHVNEYNMEI